MSKSVRTRTTRSWAVRSVSAVRSWRSRNQSQSLVDEAFEPDRWWVVRRAPARFDQPVAVVILVGTIWSYVGDAPLAVRIPFAVALLVEGIRGTALIWAKYSARRRYLATAAPVQDDGLEREDRASDRPVHSLSG
jgi:hypothetical protein